METASLSNNKQGIITLIRILPAIRQLQLADNPSLIRILAEKLDNNKQIFPFEQDKT